MATAPLFAARVMMRLAPPASSVLADRTRSAHPDMTSSALPHTQPNTTASASFFAVQTRHPAVGQGHAPDPDGEADVSVELGRADLLGIHGVRLGAAQVTPDGPTKLTQKQTLLPPQRSHNAF